MKKATQEQIENWKKEFIDVYQIEIPEDDKICYLRKPTRTELSYGSKIGLGSYEQNASIDVVRKPLLVIELHGHHHNAHESF